MKKEGREEAIPCILEPQGEHQNYSRTIRIWPEYALAYIYRGVVYAKMGSYDKASRDIDKAIQLNPKNELAYLNNGAIYSLRGQHNKAVKNYTKSIEINPNSADAYANRGWAYFELGKYNSAISDFNESLRIQQNQQRHADYYIGLAICCFQLKKYREAKFDDLVKSQKCPTTVIPAKAGIQKYRIVTKCLDTGFHRCDDFLRERQSCIIKKL